jgi:hypothetical protein
MYDPRRIEERVWILNEVQYFAYFDPDSGGVPEVTAWCEREWNRVLTTDPSHVVALTGMFHPTSPICVGMHLTEVTL